MIEFAGILAATARVSIFAITGVVLQSGRRVLPRMGSN